MFLPNSHSFLFVRSGNESSPQQAAGYQPTSVIPAEAGIQTRESGSQIKSGMTEEGRSRAAGN